MSNTANSAVKNINGARRNVDGLRLFMAVALQPPFSHEFYTRSAIPVTHINRQCVSDLQDVSIARNHLIKHWADHAAEEETRDESGDNDDGERLLRIGTDAGGKRGGQ
jgi:hypothetical protein